jgi:UDPglucose--hexose-1-phosphate uridylyltransferase
MSELRRHPFLDQWVITATHRQDRTFFPPADYNPLAPTKPGGFPTEIPFPEYDITVFENKFPSLRADAPDPAVTGSELLPVRPSHGACEVVCYSQILDSTFATLPYRQVRKLTRVWKDRFIDLSARSDVEYVFMFENKGKEIGVTLFHPHGQIYAYPFIPPIAKTELEQERKHFERSGRPLMQDVLAESTENFVFENERFAAFIPFFARYPFEVYVTPKCQIPSFAQMDNADLDDLAEALLTVTRKYDGLFGFSMPYVMAIHQQPSIEGYDFAWFHVEFYPPYRTANKLKYLAGSEAGMGAYINDTLPEVTSAQLRAIEIPPIR